MTTGERDALLFALAVAAGSADGWSYTGLGHAFVANMTGNTVLVGLAVFKPHGDVLHPLISLACYAAGAMAGSFFTRATPEGSVWSRAISLTLLLEAGLLATAEGGWVLLQQHRASVDTNALLGTVALAIGLQSGAMVKLKIPGIVTTYITGTWTTLMTGLVKLATREQRRPTGEKARFEERLLLQAGILGIYLLSAVATGWLFRYAPVGVGALPAAAVLATGTYGLMRG